MKVRFINLDDSEILKSSQSKMSIKRIIGSTLLIQTMFQTLNFVNITKLNILFFLKIEDYLNLI